MESSSDLVEFFKLETCFLADCIEHTRAVPDPARKRRKPIKEIKRWRRVRELGEGGFGVVWLEEEQDGELRAVKEIRKRDQLSSRIDISRELLAMAYFSRDASTFVKFEGWFETDARVFLAMEYLKLGDLQRCVSDPLPQDEASLITFQIAEGLKSMHSKGFTHRDLKPTNVFVVSNSPRWWIKIGDFGISKRVREDMTRLQTRMVGDYVAPEVLNLLDEDEETSQDYTSAIDMWSLGCVTHWLLTRTTPFPNGKGLLKYCQGRAPFPIVRLPAQVAIAEMRDFITSIMAIMPSNRLTAEQALRHPWLTSSADVSSSSEDESTLTAKQAEEVQSYRPRETSALSFDNAPTLVDDSIISYKQKSVRRVAGTGEQNAATHGLPSNRLAEAVNQPEHASLAKKPLVSSKYPPIDGTWSGSLEQYPPTTRFKAERRVQQEMAQRKKVKLIDLKHFAEKFKLATPVPKDLLPILAKDMSKQNKIEEQARRDTAHVTSHTYTDFAGGNPLAYRNKEPLEAPPSP
ncbi:MAG: hypothetical protein LQ347_002986 [Umbilicaria vellea]|nr:MAG: hypothetical protein LQ347_002986 [Umbilicaria vellea]